MAVRLIFLPSLKHIAIAKIAVTVYNNSRISALIDELQELEEKCSEPRCDRHQQRVKEKWTIIENKVAKKFHRRFPPVLIKKIVGALRPVHLEVKKWKEDHSDFLSSSDDACLPNLIWNSEGTINRTKTAEEWIRSGTLEIHESFFLACIYFMQREVINVWEEMTDDQKGFVMDSSNLAVNFWIDWLVNVPTKRKSFDDIANQNFNALRFWNNDFKFRLNCIFEKMTPLARQGCFWHRDWLKKVHHDDLLLCFNHMDQTEQAQMIRLYPREVLKLHMDWPFQGVFLNVFEQLVQGLDFTTFNWATTYVLFDKIRAGWKDADYAKMIQDFWNNSTPIVKSNMRQTREFYSLKIVLNYSKQQPFTIEEALEAVMCYHIHSCTATGQPPLSWLQ